MSTKSSKQPPRPQLAFELSSTPSPLVAFVSVAVEAVVAAVAVVTVVTVVAWALLGSSPSRSFLASAVAVAPSLQAFWRAFSLLRLLDEDPRELVVSPGRVTMKPVQGRALLA